MPEKNESRLAFDCAYAPLKDSDITDAVLFTLTLYPQLHIDIYASGSLCQAFEKSSIDAKSYTLHECKSVNQCDSLNTDCRDESLSVLKALSSLKQGEVSAVVSTLESSALCSFALKTMGSYSQYVALCSKIPTGGRKYLFMLDLGAVFGSDAMAYHDFARLGSACARVCLDKDAPRVRLLNALGSQVRLNPAAYNANIYLKKDSSIRYDGFISPDKIFLSDADVIVSDALSANTALLGAKGVADVYDSGSKLGRFFSKIMRPDWLSPWQYNASAVLGIKGNVVASHVHMGKNALSLALVEAVLASNLNLSAKMQDLYLKSI